MDDLYDTARMVCGAGSMKLSGVRPSRHSYAAAAGLLLSAVPAVASCRGAGGSADHPQGL